MGCQIPERYPGKGLYISSIQDKEAILEGSWRYSQGFLDRQFYGNCFQIVATSEEVPSAAGICVDQRGTEVVEILQMFIEH